MVYLIRVIVTEGMYGLKRARYIAALDELGRALSMSLPPTFLSSLREDAMAFKTREEAESQVLLMFSQGQARRDVTEYEIVEYEALR